MWVQWFQRREQCESIILVRRSFNNFWATLTKLMSPYAVIQPYNISNCGLPILVWEHRALLGFRVWCWVIWSAWYWGAFRIDVLFARSCCTFSKTDSSFWFKIPECSTCLTKRWLDLEWLERARRFIFLKLNKCTAYEQSNEINISAIYQH